jgi:hypothetical protein
MHQKLKQIEASSLVKNDEAQLDQEWRCRILFQVKMTTDKDFVKEAAELKDIQIIQVPSLRNSISDKKVCRTFWQLWTTL